MTLKLRMRQLVIICLVPCSHHAVQVQVKQNAPW
uniref:Uncharacterized protein n=1 Tax=Arundo donax TaxID=35708 RepID=A0A0A9ED94_ARUDO